MSTHDELYPLLPQRPPRRSRNVRPNYNQIHARPLPLIIHSLPPLIPHNPLSLLQIAYTYVLHLIAPPSSHPDPRIRSYYSSATNSVHVTDSSSIYLLWNHGFFGKGSLSRSEPTWLDREKKRLGLLAVNTSEEYTAARREERKRFKTERARKEREAIEEKLMEEFLVERIASNHNNAGAVPRKGPGSGKAKAGKPTLRSKYEGLAEAALLSPTKGVGFFGGEKMLPTPPASPSSESRCKEPAEKEKESKAIPTRITHALPLTTKEKRPPPDIEPQEHLELTPEEAFFLTFALGVLDIYPEPCPQPQASINSIPLTPPSLLPLFTTSSCPTTTNDVFFLLYTTYHHFRTLGWVVRPGLKFGVDYLLYLRGPVFSHAEYAVIVKPAYTHEFWRTEKGQELKCRAEGQRQRSWRWLHCLQRVQSQVRKTLVLVWVDVPPPPSAIEGYKNGDIAITTLLQGYKVREMIVKRWTPNRSRD